MDAISGFLSTNSKQQSVEETIITICDRLNHSTLLSDKRAAILTLKGFSRQYREFVVAHGLKGLISTFSIVKKLDDLNIVKSILKTFLILFIKTDLTDENIADEDEDELITINFRDQNLRIQDSEFANIKTPIDQISLFVADELLSNESNINLLIDLISENNDFYIKLYVLQVLELLVSTRTVRTKECLLSFPLNLSVLIQTLDDVHEPIRNESILLLTNLSQNNFNIQKLIAFENSFDKIFQIINLEGGIEGSIVVQDCLKLIFELLNYNSSNQTLFLETNYVPKLSNLINQPLNDPEFIWRTDQQIANMIRSIKIIEIFIIDNNHVNQKILADNGILFSLLRLIFIMKTPNKIKSKSLLACANLIKSNPDLQLSFSQIDVPYIDPSAPNSNNNNNINNSNNNNNNNNNQESDSLELIPVTVALLNWALYCNSVHTFDIRVASSIVLEAYFEDNYDAKKAFLDDQIAEYERMNGTYVEREKKQEEENNSHPQENGDSIPINGKRDEEIEKNGNGTKYETTEVNGNVNTESSAISSTENNVVETSDSTALSNDVSNNIDDKQQQAKIDSKPLMNRSANIPLGNIFKTLMDYDSNIKLNPYKVWFSCIILTNIISSNDEFKQIARSITIGDIVRGEEVITPLQSIEELLLNSLQLSLDPRVSIGYMILLICWLYNDKDSTNDFLKEYSNLISLMSYVSQPKFNMNNDLTLTDSLLIILIGVIYDSTSKDSVISRSAFYGLVIKTIGEENYITKLRQFKENDYVVKLSEDSLFHYKKDHLTGLPEVYLTYDFKIFFNNEVFPKIRKLKNPSTEPIGKLSYKILEDLEENNLHLANQYKEIKDSYDAKINELNELNLKNEEYEKGITEKTQKIDELNESKIYLENKVNELSAKLNEVSDLKANLENSSSKYYEDLQSAMSELSSLENKNKELTTQLNSIKEKTLKSDNDINKMSSDLFKLSREKDNVEKALKNLEKSSTKDLGNLKKLNADLTSTVKARDEKIVLLETKLTKAMKDLSSNQEKQHLLSSRLSESELESSKLKDLNNELLEKLNVNSRKIEALNTEKDNLTFKLEELNQKKNNEVFKMKQQLDELSKLVENQNKEISVLTTAKSQLEESKLSLEETMNDLKKEIKKLREEASKFEDDNKKLSKQHEDLKQSHEKSMEENSSVIKDLSTKLENFKQLNAELRTKNENLATDLKTENETQKNFESELKAKEKSINDLNDSKKEMEKRIEDLLSEKQKDIELLQNQENEIAALNEELNELNIQLQEIESKSKKSLAEMKQEKEYITEEKNSISSTLEMISLKMNETDSKLTESNSRNEALSKEISSKNEELKSLNKKYEILDNLFKSKTSKYEAELKTLNQNLTEKQKEIEEERKSIGENSESAIKNYLSRISSLERAEKELNEKIDELNDKNEEMERTVIQKNATIAENSDNFKSKEDELISLKKKSDDNLKELEDTKSSLNSTLSDLNKLKASSKELEASKNKINDTYIQDKAKFDSQLKKLQKYNEDLLKKNDDLRNDLAAKALALEEAKQSWENLQKELNLRTNNAEKRSTELEEKQKSLKSSSENKYNDLKSEKDKIESELSDALARLKDSEAERKSLESANNLKTEETSKLKQTLDELRKKSENLIPKSELDDLILVMSELDDKNKKYKKKLKELSVDVSSDENESDNDDEEDEDDDEEDDNDD